MWGKKRKKKLLFNNTFIYLFDFKCSASVCINRSLVRPHLHIATTSSMKAVGLVARSGRWATSSVYIQYSKHLKGSGDEKICAGCRCGGISSSPENSFERHARMHLCAATTSFLIVTWKSACLPSVRSCAFGENDSCHTTCTSQQNRTAQYLSEGGHKPLVDFLLCRQAATFGRRVSPSQVV